MIAALELDARVARAGRSLAYLLVRVPLALAAIVLLAALALGALLSVVAVGLPLALAAVAGCEALVRLDRRAANGLLAAGVAPIPGWRPPAQGSPWRRARELLADRAAWRLAGIVALEPPLAAGGLVVALVPLVVLAEVLSLGVQGVAGVGGIDYLGPLRFGAPVGLLLLALAPAAAVLAIATLAALGAASAALARGLLAPRVDPGGPVQEMLAESLGDRSVSIAYWLPDREVFVDEVGRRVELPEPGSGRAWTAVERDGHRVAAIVHDASLDTTRELVHAAAAASSLAIDNERLKADLRARLEELRVSRLRIVEATDDARRRIERDLHDGAQQQLVALALELRLLRARVRDPEALAMVDALSSRLATALEELRELARGIHPAILTERGLGPSLEALASRVPLPVDLDVQLEGRLSAAVE
ncbi:MAG TPA: sensor domain-containing protein, partial [Solirubrobacteraceae bacterium]|nr:sensor domain-containing protein [Solirubrobacteraceae bacterium]